MVLLEGFSNALNRKIYATISRAKERIKAYREQIEHIMNHEVMGDDDGPAQWSVPMYENGKAVGTITLDNIDDNSRICLVLENFETLIALSISDENRRNKYYYCIPLYHDAIQIDRQKDEFTDEDIIQYLNLIDSWFQVWVQLHSDAGCTNYTHFLDVPTTHICCYPDILLNICSSGEIFIDSHSRALKNLITYFPHFTSGGLTTEVVDTGRQRNLS